MKEVINWIQRNGFLVLVCSQYSIIVFVLTSHSLTTNDWVHYLISKSLDLIFLILKIRVFSRLYLRFLSSFIFYYFITRCHRLSCYQLQKWGRPGNPRNRIDPSLLQTLMFHVLLLTYKSCKQNYGALIN